MEDSKLVLKIPWDAKAIFKERQKRFLGIVDVIEPFKKRNLLVHVHDSGRLPELLWKGNIVYLKHENSKKRKTEYDIIGADFKTDIVFINSKYHNRIAKWVFKKLKPFGDLEQIVSEYKIGASRIDFLLKSKKEKILVEIKGCTLSKDDIALFPDAPTKRGTKHIRELIEFHKKGLETYLIFLVFQKTKCFLPNYERDVEFANIFYEALDKGVKVRFFVFSYDGKGLFYEREIFLCEKKGEKI